MAARNYYNQKAFVVDTSQFGFKVNTEDIAFSPPKDLDPHMILNVFCDLDKLFSKSSRINPVRFFMLVFVHTFIIV